MWEIFALHLWTLNLVSSFKIITHETTNGRKSYNALSGLLVPACDPLSLLLKKVAKSYPQVPTF